MSTFTLANQLKGTPILENDHRKINKIKESGDFQLEELLSNINNDTMFGAISNSSVRFDENDSTFLIPQESVDHAVLEADRHEPAFYDVLSLNTQIMTYLHLQQTRNIWKKFITSQQVASKNFQ